MAERKSIAIQLLADLPRDVIDECLQSVPQEVREFVTANPILDAVDPRIIDGTEELSSDDEQLTSNWMPSGAPVPTIERLREAKRSREATIDLAKELMTEICMKQAELAHVHADLVIRDAAIQRMKMEVKHDTKLGSLSASSAVLCVETFNNKLEEKNINLSQQVTEKIGELESQQQFSQQFLQGAPAGWQRSAICMTPLIPDPALRARIDQQNQVIAQGGQPMPIHATLSPSPPIHPGTGRQLPTVQLGPVQAPGTMPALGHQHSQCKQFKVEFSLPRSHLESELCSQVRNCSRGEVFGIHSNWREVEHSLKLEARR